MAERLELKKRVYELVPGEVFYFSAVWREVVRIDRDAGLLYYKSYDSQSGLTNTLMCKSQMLVAIKEEAGLGKAPLI